MIEIYRFDRTSLENKLIELFGDFVPPKHAKQFAAKAAGEIRFGDKASVEDGFKHFVHVATVDADDLDEAFELTNLWDDEGRVEKKAPMHSMSPTFMSAMLAKRASVGDVFRAPDGTYHMVDHVGFTPVSVQRG